MDVLGGTYVDPTGRLTRQQHCRRSRQFPRQDYLLDVATREARGRGVDSRCLHRKVVDKLLAVLPDGSEGEHSADRELFRAVVHEHQVLAHGELGDGAVTHALLGYEAEAPVSPGTGVVAGHIDTVHADRSTGLDITQAGHRLGQFALAVARDPGNAEDLTRPHLK